MRLEEQAQKLREEIEKSKEDIVRSKTREKDNRSEFQSLVEQLGVSQEVFQAYEEFYKSLNPQFSQRGGFSITCHANHGGSYVVNDKKLTLFRENVEGPYDACNFRCEASVTERKKPIVEFWPIRYPEPKSGKETTWGEHYSELYGLAIMAAPNGSHAAYEMLLALPDINQGFSRG